MKSKPKILIFAGSIRSGAYSQQLADAYVAELLSHDCDISRITLSDYPLPIMDEDLEREKGLPANAVKLAKLFAAHSGIIIVTPEYNASFTPLLKNTLDWVSRVSSDKEKPVTPYRDKLAAIASSSPGAMGGISSLNHLRDVLVRLGMQVISEQLSVGNAAKAFDHHDRLTVDRQQQILAKACASLVRKTQLLG